MSFEGGSVFDEEASLRVCVFVLDVSVDGSSIVVDVERSCSGDSQDAAMRERTQHR